MSESRDFCPRCGDPVDERVDQRPGEPREADAVLCDSCYFEDFELIDAPDRVQVTVCGRCGAVERGNRWVDLGAVDYTDVAIDAVSEALSVHVNAEDIEWGVEPEQVDETTIRMHCTFSGVVRGTPISEQIVVPVRIAKEVCDRCGRIAGGYFASILQIRAEDRPVRPEEASEAIEIAESYVAKKEQDGDREAFVTTVDRSNEAGPNVKLSTNKLGQATAKRITDRFGGTVHDYPTLVTEDGDGNEVYRVTFVARLPKYTPGDVIVPEDDEGPVLVTSAHDRLKGKRLLSGDRYEASHEDGTTPDVEKIGRVDEAVDTTVVTVEDEHAVQILDPETYEAKTVSRPDYFEPGDTVPVLKHGTTVYILPEETV
jgi:nonsense-mediated mRNA decay protein 3